MDLISAIKTGKKIMRKIHNNSLYFNDLYVAQFSKEDVLADDWEVEPEPKKKVKMYLVAFKVDKKWSVSVNYYGSIEEFLKISNAKTECFLIENSMIEVDEELP